MMAGSPPRGDGTLNSAKRSSSKKKNLEDVAREFEQRVLQGLNNSGSKRSSSIKKPEEERVLATYSQKSISNPGSTMRSKSRKLTLDKSKSSIRPDFKPSQRSTLPSNLASGNKLKLPDVDNRHRETVGGVQKMKKVSQPLQASLSLLKNKSFVQEVRETGAKNIVESRNKAKQSKLQQANEMKNELTALKQQRDEQEQIEIEKKKRQKLIRELEKEEIRHAKLVKRLESDVNRAGGEMKKLLKMKNEAEEFLEQIAELKNKNCGANNRSVSSKYTKSNISSVDLQRSNSYSEFSVHRSRRKKKSVSRKGSIRELSAGRKSAENVKTGLTHNKRSKSSKLLNQTTKSDKSDRSASKSDLKSSIKKQRLFGNQDDNITTSRSAKQSNLGDRKESTSIKSTSSNKKVSFDPLSKPVQTPNFIGDGPGKSQSHSSSNNAKQSRSQSSAGFFDIGRKNDGSRRSTDFYKPENAADQSIRVEEFETLGRKPEVSKSNTSQIISSKASATRKKKEPTLPEIPIEDRIVPPDVEIPSQQNKKKPSNKPVKTSSEPEIKTLTNKHASNSSSIKTNQPEELNANNPSTATLPAIPERTSAASRIAALKAKNSQKEVEKPSTSTTPVQKSASKITKQIKTSTPIVEEPTLTVVITTSQVESTSNKLESSLSKDAPPQQAQITFKKQTLRPGESLRSISPIPAKTTVTQSVPTENIKGSPSKTKNEKESKTSNLLQPTSTKPSKTTSNSNIAVIEAKKEIPIIKKESAPAAIKIKQQEISGSVTQPASKPQRLQQTNTVVAQPSKPRLTTGVTTLTKVASSSLKESSKRKSPEKNITKVITLEQEWAKKRPPRNPRKPPAPKLNIEETAGAPAPMHPGLAKSPYWLQIMKTENVPAPPPYHIVLDLSNPTHQRPIPPPLAVVEELMAVREKKAQEERAARETERRAARGKRLTSPPRRGTSKGSGKKTISPTMSPGTNQENSQFDGFNDSNLSRITNTTRNLDESADLLRTIYEFRKSSSTLQ